MKGGGVAGCYTLYHLAKRGIQAVLLERFQLTSGTTWSCQHFPCIKMKQKR